MHEKLHLREIDVITGNSNTNFNVGFDKFRQIWIW